MMMNFKHVLLLVLLATSITACGVRGDPQAPQPYTETK